MMPPRPRVLVVAFQGGKQADGGVESLTLIVERMHAAKLTLVSQVESAKTARWRQAGWKAEVWKLPYAPGAVSGWLRRVGGHFAWNLRVAWLAIDRQIDVVHVNDPHALWHVVFGLRLVGVPVVYNIRDTKPELSRGARTKWRCAFVLTQAQIVLSREMLVYWRRSLGIRGRSASFIYSVADFARLRPLCGNARHERRCELGLADHFTAGYVASFSEKKAQLRFIEQAGPDLQRRAPGVRVIFLGDFDPIGDPYARACAEAVRRLGLEAQMIFRGYVAGVERWYPALDVVVVATRNEGLARCMLESLACGTAVISFDVCSAREILEEGDCGTVLAQGDYAGLVSTLIMYAEKSEAAARHAARAVDVARSRFQAAQNIDAYAEIYRALSDGDRPQ